MLDTVSVVLTWFVAFFCSLCAVRAVRGQRFSKSSGEWRGAHWIDAMGFTACVLLGVWVIDDKSQTVQLIWLGCVAAGVIVGLVVKRSRSPGRGKSAG